MRQRRGGWAISGRPPPLGGVDGVQPHVLARPQGLPDVARHVIDTRFEPSMFELKWHPMTWRGQCLAGPAGLAAQRQQAGRQRGARVVHLLPAGAGAMKLDASSTAGVMFDKVLESVERNETISTAHKRKIISTTSTDILSSV